MNWKNLFKQAEDRTESRQNLTPTHSFCEGIAASGGSPWHIRKLTDKGQKFTGGADTKSLCGRQMSWDLKTPVNPHHSNICKICASAFLYPCITEVCDSFDVRIMYDRAELQGSTEEEPKSKPIVYLGEGSELAAGLRGYSLTTNFDNLCDLESFCLRHIVRLRQLAEEVDDVKMFQEIERMR